MERSTARYRRPGAAPRTSVFVTPFTVDAAAAVAGFAPVEAIADGLAHLSEQSLLVPIQSPDGLRYRMLETLRQYGRERLHETGEFEETRARHLRWCISIATGARLRFDDDLTAWGTQFDRVADDIRDAFGWASEQPARRQQAAELAMTFAGLVFARGLLSEAQQRYEQAAELTEDPAKAATALENAAGAAFCRIVGADTVRLLQAAADVALAAGHTVQAARDLATAAMVIARHRGVFATPVPPEVVDSLVAKATELAGDTPSVRAINLMVDVFRSDQDRPEQIPTANRAVALAQEAKEPLIESAALDALTISMLVTGDLGGALEMALRRVALLEPLPFHAVAGAELLDALHMVAEVSLVRGDLLAARHWAHRFSALPFLREQEHVATNRLMVIDALAGTWDELLVESERYRDGWERAGRPRGLILARGAAAVSLVHGLRGDLEAREEWRTVAAEHGYTDDVAAAVETGWAATFDAILELHFGRAINAMEHLAVDPEALRTSRGAAWRQWYAALWAEAAVLARRDDAIHRLDRARELCAGNPVASAIVERGYGFATQDRARVVAAVPVLDDAGCRYQWARSLVLAGGKHRREGEAALRAMGAAPTVVPDLS